MKMMLIDPKAILTPLIFGALIFAALMPGAAQAEAYPFDPDAWTFTAKESEITDYRGERAVKIKGGYATIDDLTILDGVIEFDIAVAEERGFAGAIFREQDLSNYEHFYIRPHQSGNPDANQYTPVFGGVSAWQLYYGEEFASPIKYRFDDWMHIKIVFAGDQAEVFIDSEEPVLKINDLRRETESGGVGFGAGNFAPAYFANFTVSALPENYRFASSDHSIKEPDPNTVLSWQVSSAMPEDTVDEFIKKEQQWSTLDAENSGITNLARAAGVSKSNRTVVARLVVDSDNKQLKGLAFGYSDSVTVYVNGVPLYSGTNRYESRDYRYLGTVGLFDRVFVPLKEGQNEILFAVSEAFGGWGIVARFDDMQGLQLTNK
jgi:hypothetical protein